MKKTSLLLLFQLVLVCAFAQAPAKDPQTSIVDASCWQCQFGMQPKNSCDLAVRIEDKTYFVDGTDINAHGDAHAKDGFCNAVRKAEVKGELINGRYKVSFFKLIQPAVKKD